MPRIRTIKPQFWDSPGTARASLRARLLYIAMWNWADDYGIGTANPKALIGFAFPNDDDISASEFPTLRKEVADCFGVHFYSIDGRPYFCIPSWDKHQRTERKAKGLHPGPPSDVSAGQRLGDGTSDDTQGNTEANDGSSGVGRRKKEEGSKDSCASADAEREFETWWETYPRKRGKGQAAKAYRAARKKVEADTLLTALQQQSPTLTARGAEFVPYPATWLNGERWADQPDDDTDHHPVLGKGYRDIDAEFAAKAASQ